MNKHGKAKQIVRRYALWAAGGGFIPAPVVNVATVTGLQVSMLERLSKLYDADYSRSTAQMFISAVTGTTVLSMGYRASNVLRFVPGVGLLAGGATMGALAAASTYALGQVTINSLETTGDLLRVDMVQAKNTFEEALNRGKEVVSRWQQGHEASEENVGVPVKADPAEPALDLDALALLERLAALHDKGLLTDSEFDAQKEKLLSRL
ncbi:MAG: SHOCT domain-containing protein [Deinococcota bacterium]